MMEDPEEQKARRGLSNFSKAFQAVGPIFTLGIQLAAAVVLMFLVGHWLDRQWGTAPWMLIVCTTFGFAAGMYQFIKTVNEVGKHESEDQEGNKR